MRSVFFAFVCVLCTASAQVPPCCSLCPEGSLCLYVGDFCQCISPGSPAAVSVGVAVGGGSGNSYESKRVPASGTSAIPLEPVVPVDAGTGNIAGEWVEWVPWQPCSITCGTGFRQRFRECPHGKDCSHAGVGFEVQACEKEACPSVKETTAPPPADSALQASAKQCDPTSMSCFSDCMRDHQCPGYCNPTSGECKCLCSTNIRRLGVLNGPSDCEETTCDARCKTKNPDSFGLCADGKCQCRHM
ncbi:hypothetical protein AAVH_06318 [Aphelenchoides avenae]|nr:hypothetical protein AAVH_06318 [Aphelenchus avenae]